LANDRFMTIGQGGEVLSHGCQGHAHLLGDLQVQALAVLFQALQGFGHGDMSSKKEGGFRSPRGEKNAHARWAFRFGVPTGIRTPVIAVKGRCPRPLDDGDKAECLVLEGGGGAKRDRTADLLHAMQALSQLSYSPTASREL